MDKKGDSFKGQLGSAGTTRLISSSKAMAQGVTLKAVLEAGDSARVYI